MCGSIICRFPFGRSRTGNWLNNTKSQAKWMLFFFWLPCTVRHSFSVFVFLFILIYSAFILRCCCCCFSFHFVLFVTFFRCVFIRSLFIKFLLYRLFTFIYFSVSNFDSFRWFFFSSCSSSSSMPYNFRILSFSFSLLLLFVYFSVYYLMGIEIRQNIFPHTKSYVEIDDCTFLFQFSLFRLWCHPDQRNSQWILQWTDPISVWFQKKIGLTVIETELLSDNDWPANKPRIVVVY